MRAATLFTSLAGVALALALAACGQVPAATKAVPSPKPGVSFKLAPLVANSGAAFTTVNEAVDGTGHCTNGGVNCNLYDGKPYVWLNGGPDGAAFADGEWFFAVLNPGGQANPNDGSAENLSDDFDAYTNRTFTVSGGNVSYSGTHDVSGNRIRLMPYADTSNPGGVYILAACRLNGGYPVDPSSCKYDAFKVTEASTVGINRPAPTAGLPLTVIKDAAGAYYRIYYWHVAKTVDKPQVKQVGGNVTFNSTVTVSHDDGHPWLSRVSGTISIVNPNVDASLATVPVAITGVTDQLSDGTACTVVNGGAQTLTQFQTDFAYSCDLVTKVPAADVTNTVTVGWGQQDLSNGTTLAAGSASFGVTVPKGTFVETVIDSCANIRDSSAGALGTVCLSGSNPTIYTYQRTVPVPQYGCQSYDNTASLVTNDSASVTCHDDPNSVTVKVCGPANTGGLTMGFWQNKNGQGIITGGGSTLGVCNSGTWLRQFAPFQDLSTTASCAATATYVFNVVKAASAGGDAMNPMLKAQMLATALDVYFSDPTLGGNKINAPNPIGGFVVDLTQIYKFNLGIYENVSAAFGGAPALTVQEMLTYAASQSNAGGSAWYGQVKATQELAKDAFDAINNRWAFAF
ncbi:MAG TPA: hypothetical protein VHN99_06255 [Deinococcales bacterium]|nr:hypothetical protein [Deinococcales bacterium]